MCFYPDRSRRESRSGRDEHSTTYVGAIETAEALGIRIYAEAIRRGVTRATTVIIVGDEHAGFGQLPKNTSTGRSRSSISITRGNTWP